MPDQKDKQPKDKQQEPNKDVVANKIPPKTEVTGKQAGPEKEEKSKGEIAPNQDQTQAPKLNLGEEAQELTDSTSSDPDQQLAEAKKEVEQIANSNVSVNLDHRKEVGANIKSTLDSDEKSDDDKFAELSALTANYQSPDQKDSITQDYISLLQKSVFQGQEKSSQEKSEALAAISETYSGLLEEKSPDQTPAQNLEDRLSQLQTYSDIGEKLTKNQSAASMSSNAANANRRLSANIARDSQQSNNLNAVQASGAQQARNSAPESNAKNQSQSEQSKNPKSKNLLKDILEEAGVKKGSFLYRAALAGAFLGRLFIGKKNMNQLLSEVSNHMGIATSGMSAEGINNFVKAASNFLPPNQQQLLSNVMSGAMSPQARARTPLNPRQVHSKITQGQNSQSSSGSGITPRAQNNRSSSGLDPFWGNNNNAPTTEDIVNDLLDSEYKGLKPYATYRDLFESLGMDTEKTDPNLVFGVFSHMAENGLSDPAVVMAEPGKPIEFVTTQNPLQLAESLLNGTYSSQNQGLVLNDIGQKASANQQGAFFGGTLGEYIAKQPGVDIAAVLNEAEKQLAEHISQAQSTQSNNSVQTETGGFREDSQNTKTNVAEARTNQTTARTNQTTARTNQTTLAQKTADNSLEKLKSEVDAINPTRKAKLDKMMEFLPQEFEKQKSEDPRLQKASFGEFAVLYAMKESGSADNMRKSSEDPNYLSDIERELGFEVKDRSSWESLKKDADNHYQYHQQLAQQDNYQGTEAFQKKESQKQSIVDKESEIQKNREEFFAANQEKAKARVEEMNSQNPGRGATVDNILANLAVEEAQNNPNIEQELGFNSRDLKSSMDLASSAKEFLKSQAKQNENSQDSQEAEKEVESSQTMSSNGFPQVFPGAGKPEDRAEKRLNAAKNNLGEAENSLNEAANVGLGTQEEKQKEQKQEQEQEKGPDLSADNAGQEVVAESQGQENQSDTVMQEVAGMVSMSSNSQQPISQAGPASVPDGVEKNDNSAVESLTESLNSQQNDNNIAQTEKLEQEEQQERESEERGQGQDSEPKQGTVLQQVAQGVQDIMTNETVQEVVDTLSKTEVKLDKENGQENQKEGKQSQVANENQQSNSQSKEQQGDNKGKGSWVKKLGLNKEDDRQNGQNNTNQQQDGQSVSQGRQ